MKLSRLTLALLCVSATGLSMVVTAGPAQAWGRTSCETPSVTYDGKGNFFNVYHETLSAEVCFNGRSAWVVWSSSRFSAVPNWSEADLGKGTFFDPHRYGGSMTVWRNARVTFSFGPVSMSQDVFLRIWMRPDGRVWTFGGL